MESSGEVLAALRARVAELESALATAEPVPPQAAVINGVPINWDISRGVIATPEMRVVMMWVDTTVAGLLLGVRATVGPQRFALCLRGCRKAEARNQGGARDFVETFRHYSDVYGACGWGRWELEDLDQVGRRARISVLDSWEGRLQRGLGTCWGSCILAGILSALCSDLFGCSCWAEQTSFLARGDAHDAFLVEPSTRTVEAELDRLLETPEATSADMAVALQRLRQEAEERARLQAAQKALRKNLEQVVEQRTRELAATHERLRQEVRERLRAEELFRLTAEAIPEAVVILTLPDFKPVFMNRSFSETLGYDAHTVPDFQTWTARAHPDHQGREAALQQVRRVLEDPHPEFTCETRVRVAWGVDRDMAVWGARLDPRRLLLVLSDVTEQRRAEKDRLRLHEQRQRAQKMEALGLLAGGVAHDLNNILTGLVTYPDLYLEGLEADDPMRAPLETILQTGMRARAVVEDLMTIARGVAAPRQECDLNQVIRDCLDAADQPGLGASLERDRLELDLCPQQLSIYAAPTQLCRSLANLVRYATLTPGRVRVSTARRAVQASVPGFEDVEPGHYAVLSVEDRGPEVPAQHLSRIFEPFFVRQVMARGQTGLELAVVWNIVRDHRGSIQVRSGPQGTRFDLFFPIRRPSENRGSA